MQWKRWVAAAAVGAVLLAAAPAAAHGTVDQEFVPGDGGSPFSVACPDLCEVGQPFVASDSSLTGAEIYGDNSVDRGIFTIEVREGAGFSGPTIAGPVEITWVDASDGSRQWAHGDFDPAPVLEAGQTYTIVATGQEAGWFGADGQEGHVFYIRDAASQTYTYHTFRLYHRVYADPTVNDVDGDGVVDTADRCEDTTVGGATPPHWNRNRYWDDASGRFVTGNGSDSGYTLADTGGCSGAQIVEVEQLGRGHSTRGLSGEELDAWVAKIAAAPPR